jgi:hypothetical protein
MHATMHALIKLQHEPSEAFDPAQFTRHPEGPYVSGRPGTGPAGYPALVVKLPS